MRIRARSWLAEGLLVLLALGTLGLLPGCPFFTRQEHDDSAPVEPPEGENHDHAHGGH